MKKAFLIILFLLSIKVESQVKTAPIKQTNVSEIDKLYKKYKNSKTLILYTSYGDLNGEVKIDLNDDDKPTSITIGSAKSKNSSAVVEFIVNTVKITSIPI